LIYILTAGILLISCEKINKSNPEVSKLLAEIKYPVDSLAFYFRNTTMDSSDQVFYSSILFNFKEPILSKDFIGLNVYRFLWVRSFHRPVVISLYHSGKKVFMNVKILNHLPHFHKDTTQVIDPEERSKYLEYGYVADLSDSTILILKPDRKAQIIFNKNIVFSKKTWTDFEKLLEKENYWAMPEKNEGGGADGASWIIEAHFKNKYRAVDRWSPFTSFRDVGLFLIKKSGIKEEIY
jgi:hypothetical protein